MITKISVILSVIPISGLIYQRAYFEANKNNFSDEVIEKELFYLYMKNYVDTFYEGELKEALRTARCETLEGCPDREKIESFQATYPDTIRGIKNIVSVELTKQKRRNNNESMAEI